jgi:hypothetical protein
MPSTYFSKFIPLVYPNRDDSLKVVSDIFFRAQFALEAKADASLYYEYEIKDSDSPEILAYKYYGSPSYHWIVLLANDMLDPLYDWPMSGVVFDRYLANKYGDEINGIHHYETLQLVAPDDGYGYTAGDTILDAGITCNSTFRYAYAGGTFEAPDAGIKVLNYDYEFKLNEAKRKIRLLDNKYLSDFIKNFDSLIDDRE